MSESHHGRSVNRTRARFGGALVPSSCLGVALLFGACDRPAEPKTAGAKAADAKADDAKTGDAKAAATKTADTKTGDAKAAATKTADTKTGGAKVAESGAPAVEPTPGTDPASASGPLPWSGKETPSRNELLSETMEQRIRGDLRKTHDAATQLAAKIVLAEADGGATVLALYEYSAFEACVAEGGGTKEARSACVGAAVNSADEPMEELRQCTRRGLVRARFGPPPTEDPNGGALTLVGTQPLEGGCTIDTVHRFGLDDADGDGKPELQVRLLTKTPDMTTRAPQRFDRIVHRVTWFRGDLTPQHEIELGTWGDINEVPESSDIKRFELRDTNGDGHGDLVMESFFLEAPVCTIGPEGWPKSLDDCDIEASDVEHETLVYDPKKDQWG